MKYISDVVFGTGISMVFVGVTFAYGWPLACIIAGSILMVIGAAVGLIKALAQIKGGP